MTEPAVEFETPEELNDLLERIGLRLHGINRIAGEESKALWHIAETLRATGRMALSFEAEPCQESLVEFSNSGRTLSKNSELDLFLARLKEEVG